MDRISFLFFLMVKISSLDVSSGKMNDEKTYSFLMPDDGVRLYKNDLLLCTQIMIRDKFYLVGFEPKGSMDVYGHIFLFGCATPGSNETLWNCDTLQRDHNRFYKKANPCRDGAQVIYAWSRNMKSLRLPNGVGFLVGSPQTKYLVLQVHYKHISKGFDKGTPGVYLNYTKKTTPRKAGMLVMGSRGVVQPRSMEHMEITCTIRENKVIHPFAYGVHTHKLGKVVSGYVVREGDNADFWSPLGKKDPQKDQKYYAVKDTTPIRKGDILAVRCTMDNKNGHTIVTIGKSDTQEMCNFYLLYWVEEHQETLNLKFCSSLGPPAYYWQRSLENFQNIPHKDASTLPVENSDY